MACIYFHQANSFNVKIFQNSTLEKMPTYNWDVFRKSRWLDSSQCEENNIKDCEGNWTIEDDDGWFLDKNITIQCGEFCNRLCYLEVHQAIKTVGNMVFDKFLLKFTDGTNFQEFKLNFQMEAI